MKLVKSHQWAVIVAFCVGGCSGPFTTTVVMDDGSNIETMPRCVWGDRLVADGFDEGIEVDRISDMRSHAGLEPAIIGGAILAVGAGLLISTLVTQDYDELYELRVATGGVASGSGLILLTMGLILHGISVGSLDRACSPRRSDLPPGSFP